MLKQQEDIEAESAEMQEFLQAEKMALGDSLQDLETEVVLLSCDFTFAIDNLILYVSKYVRISIPVISELKFINIKFLFMHIYFVI